MKVFNVCGNVMSICENVCMWQLVYTYSSGECTIVLCICGLKSCPSVPGVYMYKLSKRVILFLHPMLLCVWECLRYSMVYTLIWTVVRAVRIMPYVHMLMESAYTCVDNSPWNGSWEFTVLMYIERETVCVWVCLCVLVSWCVFEMGDDFNSVYGVLRVDVVWLGGWHRCYSGICSWMWKVCKSHCRVVSDELGSELVSEDPEQRLRRQRWYI